jgi:nucleoside-diphosphate-sugar epimerase
MNTAFVTGGSGFVGRNLIRALVARGDTVMALARSDSSAAAVRALGAQPVTGDLNDFHALRNGMSGCGVVYHAAAEVSEWGPRERFHEFNVAGTQNVLTAAKAAGVKCVVHVSTEAVLANGGPLHDVDETRPYPHKPLPRYPGTKAESERLVVAANTPQLRTVVIRPRMIWGGDDSSLLPQLIAAVKSGRFAWIGGGRQLTSTTHVENVVEGLLLAAECGRGGQIYFVTDGPPTELKAFITTLMRAQGVDPGDKSVPHGVALAAATVTEWLWDTLGLKNPPPVTRMAVRLFGEQVTVNDAKARREIGYAGRVSRDAVLAELRKAAGTS